MRVLVLSVCLVLAEVRVFLPWTDVNSLILGEFPAVHSHLMGEIWPDFTRENTFLLFPVTLTVHSPRISALSMPTVTSSVLDPHLIQVAFSDMNSAISFNWTAESWYTTSGQAELQLSNLTLLANVSLDSSAGWLTLTTTNVSASFGQMQTQLSGTYVDSMYEILDLLEEDWMRTEIGEQLSATVQSQIDAKLRGINVSPIVPLQRSRLVANFSLLAAPEAENSGVLLDFAGAFSDEGECLDDTPLPTIASEKPTAVLSAGTLSSWLQAMNAVELSGWALHPFSIPEAANVTLSTAQWEEAFPGLVETYGDQQMFLFCEFVVPPEVLLSGAEAQLSALEICYFRILCVSDPFARATVQTTYSWRLVTKRAELLGHIYPVNSKVLDVDVDFTGAKQQPERKTAVEQLLAELWSASGPFLYPSRGVLLPVSIEDQCVEDGYLILTAALTSHSL